MYVTFIWIIESLSGTWCCRFRTSMTRGLVFTVPLGSVTVIDGIVILPGRVAMKVSTAVIATVLRPLMIVIEFCS